MSVNAENKTLNLIHPDLRAAIEILYQPNEFHYSQAVIDKESFEYGACTFKLNNLVIKFRVAKITPTKIGQFVTLWKRIGNGPIQPYDSSDPFDLFVVSTKKENSFGQFVFPKSVLCEKNIISQNGKGGKRAIRVYPPWDKTISSQAQKTQEWQLEYFLEISENWRVDINKLQKLYLLD